MPLIALSLLLQIACCVHVVRSGRPHYWDSTSSIIGSFLAWAVYFFAEVLPNLASRPLARRVAQGSATRRWIPRHGKRRAARQLDHRRHPGKPPSPRRTEHGQRRLPQALELYRNSLSGMYRTDPTLMLGLAQAQFALELPAEARDTLEALIARTRPSAPRRPPALRARRRSQRRPRRGAARVRSARAGLSGRRRRACATRSCSSARASARRPPSVCERGDQARSLAPKYYQREQRAWVELAKRELQDLA
jgi:hypothetical protein